MNTDDQQKETKLQSLHDPFFRSTFSEPSLFRKLLIWLLPFLAELLDLDRMECEKDSFVDEQLKAHYSDIIYKIPLRGTDQNIVVFVLLEHKTSSDRFTMLQVLRYIVLIWLREYNQAKDEKRLANFMLPPVLPIIVYHGEHKFTAPVRLGKLIRPVEGFEQYMLDFESIVLDLTQIDETGLPEDLELSAVLAVMQAVFRKDVADRVLRIYRKLKPKLNDPQYHDRWVNLLRYLLTSSKYFSKESFIEVTSQMSDTDVATISPFAQELIAVGEATGFEKGEATGEAKSIIRTLTKRFQTIAPAITEKVHALHDLHELDKLADFAYDCQSIDEFEAALSK